MDNMIRQTTRLALHMVRAYVKQGDTVIDATCGNGHDTLALAEMGPARLYAFDVQEQAVRATVSLLEAGGFGDRLTDGSYIVQQLPHEDLLPYFSASSRGTVKAVLFNLGYLPGGDKTITTEAETTLAAVRGAMDLITTDGLICVTMYSGHAEGKREKAALLDFAGEFDAGKWHTAYISMPNQKHDPPEILLITRKR